MTRTIVAFDTETATLRGAPHLVELGAVRAVDGEIVDRFERFVRPEVPIEPAATAIHGITDADVRDADGASAVLAAFAAWAGDDWLAAHNARFDAHVLGFEAARYSADLPRGPLIDTLALARRFVGDAPDHKLDTLTAHLELEIDTHHRALPDAVSCWLVLDECRARAESIAAPGTGGWGELFARGTVLPCFAEARPRPARIPRRLRALEEACRERARITLLYGVEGPPSPLAVVPRIVFELGRRGYLEAECVRSGTLKTYRLDRVQRILA